MLKIVLDARKINHGGIGTYIRNLIDQFKQRDDVDLRLIAEEGIENLPSIIYPYRAYSALEHFLWAKQLNSSKLIDDSDLLHSPHFTLARGIKIPSVITIHDLIQISHPESWYYPIAAKFYLNYSIERAKEIITVSTATKNELLRYFPNKAAQLSKKITVIPNAILASFTNLAQNYLEIISEKYDLAPGYLLAVFSNVKPHKGLEDLLRAYLRVSENTRLPSLVLVGDGAKTNFSSVFGPLSELRTKNIFALGRVEAEFLPSLYAGSSAVICPTKIEGFGLPALEAKCFARRLLIRPCPALLEFTQKEDLVCKDFSLPALEDGLRLLVSSVGDYNFSGIDRSILSQYSPERIAGLTLEVYKKALK